LYFIRISDASRKGAKAQQRIPFFFPHPKPLSAFAPWRDKQIHHSITNQSATLEKFYVRSLFDSIAHRYDLLNHLLSGGMDFYWRRRAVECLRDIRPERILDVATGTADFAIESLRLHPKQVVGVDIAQNMLAIGREKIQRKGCQDTIELRQGEAEHLDFPDGSMDAAIVGFGARNFEHLAQGLGEMYRVLRQGGRIVVLEFSRPAHTPFKQMYFFYFRRILPVVGRAVSKNKEAYTYLPDTVMRFPEGDDFCAILRKIGFCSVRQERLTFGIATIYTGDK
jgi:demethylmenaquinone methyltransferase / 2-methoxy-6-polyprenyl-1,4-benzoquinol methylase